MCCRGSACGDPRQVERTFLGGKLVMRGFICNAGVYLMEIPRQVDHIFLSNGNRAELLVKCTAPAGKRYALAASAGPSQFGALFRSSFGGAESLVQPVVLTIEVEASQVSGRPSPI